MAFVRVKRIKGHEYAYLVESRWDPRRKTSRQVTIKYLGRADELTLESIPRRYRSARVRAFLRRQSARNVARRGRTVEGLRDRLLRAILAADRDATTSLMNEGFETLGLDALYLEVVTPAMRAIGDLWEGGTIPVSQEHAASNLVIQNLDHMNAAIRILRPPRGTAALCTPPGEEHALATKVLEGLLARRRYRPLNASSSAPLESIVGYLAGLAPEVVLISITMEEHLPSTKRLTAALRRELPSATLLVGGQAVHRARQKDFPGVALVRPEATLQALDGLAG